MGGPRGKTTDSVVFAIMHVMDGALYREAQESGSLGWVHFRSHAPQQGMHVCHYRGRPFPTKGCWMRSYQ